MKTKILLSILTIGLIVNAFSQNTIELIFTAENNGQYTSLDSILIENLTQGGDTIIYAPDTILVLDYITNICEHNSFGENTFTISQNYPNPFTDQTTISLFLAEKEYVTITINDISGREAYGFEQVLNQGNHLFTFFPGKEKYYVFSASTSTDTKSIKMANMNVREQIQSKLKYNGQNGAYMKLKSEKAITEFVYSLGDELLFVGYVDLGESGIIASPSANQTYTFQFASNVPCIGTPTVTFEGQVYNTIQIFGQCWLKENMNVGEMIPGTQDMEDNEVIEKYCYDDDPANCDIYGGLYQWHEIMQYTTQQGTQGICPPGWHIPKDQEWKVLEGTVDSQYGIGNPEWNLEMEWRGYDVGERLKSVNGWDNNGNGTDLYGFTALPSGGHSESGFFQGLGTECSLPSSSSPYINSQMGRSLTYEATGVYRSALGSLDYGRSVRCIKDN